MKEYVVFEALRSTLELFELLLGVVSGFIVMPFLLFMLIL
jgi:hypothetical protein